MANLRNTNASVSTTTIDKNEFDQKTENIYESISVVAKRAIQINSEIKKELLEKLEEFATYSDNLEEVFENKEQIEVSKFYEKLPKPHALAVEEWLNDKIYFRNTEREE
jgi:DNA-directed RNA polymerase subunit K/omega